MYAAILKCSICDFPCQIRCFIAGTNMVLRSEISGSHGGEYEDEYLSGPCDGAQHL
jgi:hypothetical protein